MSKRLVLETFALTVAWLVAACSSDDLAFLDGGDTGVRGFSDATAGEGGPTSGGTGPTNATGSGAGAGLEGGIDDVCGTLSIPADVEVISDHGNVLIIFDQSESMTSQFAGEPLWRAASNAVTEALTPHQDNLTVGAVFFPTAPGGGFTCPEDVVESIGSPPQIPFQAGPSFLGAWASRWSSANLVTGTPTERAMVVGDAALDAAGLSGGTAVILVTDGGSTCWATRPRESEQVAAEWLGEGIKTYVVGLGGVLALGELTSIAQAGGTVQEFTPADGAALSKELDRIVTKLVRSGLSSCRITFEETPASFDEIDLIVTDAASGQRFRVPEGPEGWQALPGNQGAELRGQTCTDALGGRFSNVSFDFGCEDIPLLI